MNQAPTNQSGTGTFSSGTSPAQSNPFTQDLESEFTSNFGTNTNAVSQIFKEGGFGGQNRTRTMAIILLAVLVVGVGVYLLIPSPVIEETKPAEVSDVASDEDKATEEESAETKETPTTESAATDPAKRAAETTTAAVANPPQAKTLSQTRTAAATGKPALGEPAASSTLTYDETAGPAMFTWEGGGGTIIFSRSSSMKPEVLRAQGNGTYQFQHPYPGTWYWQVQNSMGQSEVRTFNVEPPQRRTVTLSQPQSGGTVAGNGGAVSWQGDSKVAFYRVELSTGSFANPQYRFATSGTTLSLQGVTAGSYQMRIGAFSEVAGRWEYTTPVQVTVQ